MGLNPHNYKGHPIVTTDCEQFEGVQDCTERCPQHDGKRCDILGYKAPELNVCPVWAYLMVNTQSEAEE